MRSGKYFEIEKMLVVADGIDDPLDDPYPKD
jgi:hypothetical protein